MRLIIDRFIFHIYVSSVFLLLENAVGNLGQRLGYGMGSALLVAVILLAGSVKKWLQNHWIACGRGVELRGLRVRHRGVQEWLCELQRTCHGKCVTMPAPPSGGV